MCCKQLSAARTTAPNPHPTPHPRPPALPTQMARARSDVLAGDLPAAATKLQTAVKVDQDMGYME